METARTEASADKSDAHEFWNRVKSTVSIAIPATHTAISVVTSTIRMSLPRTVRRTPTKLGRGAKKRDARLTKNDPSAWRPIGERQSPDSPREARSGLQLPEPRSSVHNRETSDLRDPAPGSQRRGVPN